jgi:hypothetical protein
MRTAIYVYQPTTLTLTCTELLRLSTLGREAGDIELVAGVTTFAVAPGVYRVRAATPIAVTGAHTDVVTMDADDRYPDPPERVFETFPSITYGKLARFFRRNFAGYVYRRPSTNPSGT